MDLQISQRTRYLLQTRTRRVKTALINQYGERLSFFLQFIEENIAFKNILNEVLVKSNIADEDVCHALDRGQVSNFKSETDYVAGVFYSLKYLINHFENDHDNNHLVRVSYYFTGSHSGGVEQYIENINDSCVEFLADHLDEQLDSSQTLMLLLYKYKHSAEWFNRKKLCLIARGEIEYCDDKEKGLANHLYQYLFDQGIEFNIEPSSSSGRADLVTSQSNEARIILDAKYISIDSSNSSIKKKVQDGFGQVHHYCCDYNSEFGYLVIFKDSDNVIEIESEKLGTFNYVNINGKVIFFLVIDIYEYKESASKRGAPKIISVSKEDLRKELSIGND
ncbi:hypothetical protein DAY19_14340 [Halobacteriovorax vibrionivorans]|uniref:Restriction endonuclease type IV Mrr domain-containing protein n=1 Tax=Halobacteriovorax vibrionivorans TaxID=2152716 RepID=A0ABY0IGB4_9BACT|nr:MULTISPECIES: hypothetical protein [Halobacteriovorax]RZF21153.1 hypothetical protein DAY19_14340 [Halobacteriovorax vibrionivorans]TGD46250.1 hypothetical protein EP118_12675 [Halobacteriovorax sp. Y22]